MTSIDRARRSARRIASDGRAATRTAQAQGEMLHAAGEVIAARMDIMRAGMTDPGKADLREMALMSSEKVEAVTASATAVAATLTTMGQRMGRAAMQEASIAGRAASAMATAATPQGMAAAQYGYMVGWWGRAAGQALSFNSELLKAQADALAPIHKAATENARRLKK